jgi:hypothetical protein
MAALVLVHAGCATMEPTEIELSPLRPSAEQETKRVTDIIESSKAAPAEIAPTLQRASTSVLARSFGALVEEKLVVGMPELTCFAEGCLYRVVYVNRCAQLRADAVFTSDRSLALLEWPGSVGRTPPITGANGQVSVTWTLYLTAKQYPLLGKIPRPGGTTFPPPVPPCPLQRGTSDAIKTAPEAP